MKVKFPLKQTFILASVVSAYMMTSSALAKTEVNPSKPATTSSARSGLLSKFFPQLNKDKLSLNKAAATSEKTVVPYRPGAKAPPKSSGLGPIEFALDKINKTNKNSNNLGKVPTTTAECRDCDNIVKGMQFNTCNNKNDYLEQQIDQIKNGNSFTAAMINAPLRNDTVLKHSCVQMGMSYKFNANNNSFRQCAGNGYSSKVIRPCLSEDYFKMVSNSFDAVSKCMTSYLSPKESTSSHKQDILAVYAMINVESGFHVNAVSGTGAGGIGQFTGTAITSVNQNHLSKVRKTLKGTGNPVCNRLADEVLGETPSMAASSGLSCERISIHNGNPALNMVYTYASLKGTKDTMDNVLFEHERYSNKFSSLSHDEVEKIKRAVMIWAHNTGPSGAWTPAKALLNSYYKTRKVGSADEFINKLEQYMRSHPASSNSKAARRKETSNYYPKISAALKSIEKNIGGGSCLN